MPNPGSIASTLKGFVQPPIHSVTEPNETVRLQKPLRHCSQESMAVTWGPRETDK